MPTSVRIGLAVLIALATVILVAVNSGLVVAAVGGLVAGLVLVGFVSRFSAKALVSLAVLVLGVVIVLLQSIRLPSGFAPPTYTLPYAAEVSLAGAPERWVIQERYALQAEDGTNLQLPAGVDLPPGWSHQGPVDGVPILVGPRRQLDIPPWSFLGNLTSWVSFEASDLIIDGERFVPARGAEVTVTAPSWAIVRSEPGPATQRTAHEGAAEQRVFMLGSRFGTTPTLSLETTPTWARNELLFRLITVSLSGTFAAALAAVWALVVALFRDELKEQLKKLVARLRPPPPAGPPSDGQKRRRPALKKEPVPR